MDTEEDIEIKHNTLLGKVQTDEGPYYHEPWWEAYKGSVKGKLGGIIIGAGVGALVGLGASFLIPGLLAAVGSVGAVVGPFALAGMFYAMHEFADIGKIVGSNAATAEKQEKRLKEFETGKFSELKKEISELKAMLTGKKAAAVAESPAMEKTAGKASEKPEDNGVPEHSSKYRNERNSHLLDYRTQHCDDEHCPPAGQRRLIFWKVALIGLAVGMGAGALIGATGMTSLLVEHMFTHAVAAKVTEIGILAPMGILGLFGASFGINRDMFRQVFDKTDLWFRGIVRDGHARAKQIMTSVSHWKEKTQAHAAEAKPAAKPEVATIAAVADYSGYIDYPTSSTYHRDKVLAAAEKALLSFDHTRATPQ